VKILFVAAQLYFPQLYGGVQTATDQLCHALIKKGYKVSLLVKVMPGGMFGWICRLKMQINKALHGCNISRDTGLGYPVWRTWFPAQAIKYVSTREKPDLIVLMTGNVVPLAEAARPTGIPMLVQLHDVAFHAQGGNFAELGTIPCVANSQFTAKKYHGAFGTSSVIIYPFIATEKYRTKTTRENVTFVNPHSRKGLEIALKIARLCPDIPFSFVEGWTLSPEQHQKLMDELRSLPNVTFFPSQEDMAKVYGKCRILLVPSIAEETYGRVVTEAQISGIPVVASNRGALPESVGPGGILLDPESPIDNWVEAIRKLWQDDNYYAEFSAAALAHAQRPEMDFSFQIDAHEKALLAAAGRLKNNG